MKKRKKGMAKTLAGMLSVLLLAAEAAGCGKGDVLLVAPIISKQVIKVDGEGCTLPQAKVYLLNYQNLYGTVYGVDLWENGADDEALKAYIKNLTISQLAKILSMDSLANSMGIELEEEEKANIEKAAQVYYNSLSSAELSWLEVEVSDIRKLYEDYALAQKVYASLTAEINNEVSDDEARIMEAMQIFVEDKDTAKAVEKALQDGGDFSSLANSYNEAAETTIQFGRGELPQEVEKAAFSLGNGENTGCIKTEDGYYFIHCINKFNQELTDANKEKIVRQREKEAFGDVYDAYSSTLSKKMYQDVWEKVTIQYSKELSSDRFFEVYQEYCKAM